jgi:hypothetical protein
MSVIMLSVVKLNVVMLGVVDPFEKHKNKQTRLSAYTILRNEQTTLSTNDTRC